MYLTESPISSNNPISARGDEISSCPPPNLRLRQTWRISAPFRPSSKLQIRRRWYVSSTSIRAAFSPSHRSNILLKKPIPFATDTLPFCDNTPVYRSGALSARVGLLTSRRETFKRFSFTPFFVHTCGTVDVDCDLLTILHQVIQAAMSYNEYRLRSFTPCMSTRKFRPIDSIDMGNSGAEEETCPAEKF